MSSQIGSVYVAHVCFNQEYYELFDKLLCVIGEPVQVASHVVPCDSQCSSSPLGDNPGEIIFFGIIALELILLSFYSKDTGQDPKMRQEIK